MKVGRRGLGAWPGDSLDLSKTLEESWICLLVIFKTVSEKLHVQSRKEFRDGSGGGVQK